MRKGATAPVALAEYYKLYQLALSYEGKSPKTIVVYFSNMNRFLRYLQAKLEREPLLSDLDSDAVMAYIVHLKTVGKFESHPFSPPSDAPLSAFALDQHVRTLKGFATWLHEKQYTRQNALRTLERPKRPTLTMEPLSDDEIKRILASINTKTFRGARDYALMVFFLDTGLRSGEVCGLLLQDTHLGDRHPYVKVFGKGQKERVVYVGQRAHEALLAYRTFVRPHHTSNPNEKHFFVQRKGKPLNVGTMQEITARIARDAKVPRLHPHLLRHTSRRPFGRLISTSMGCGPPPGAGLLTLAVRCAKQHRIGQLPGDMSES
jgi:site-specific recombinase XerD